MPDQNIDPIDQRTMDSTGENNAAAISLSYEAVRKVRPDLAGELKLNVSYSSLLRAEASKEEISEVVSLLRPYAERSFADPRARYITWFLIALGIKDIDVSYVVDDMELLQDSPKGRRALNDDSDLLSETASPDNIHHINRALRLSGEHVHSAQLMIIADGVRKKFFRRAPELQWVKNSHFRGVNPRMDRALDRMGT